MVAKETSLSKSVIYSDNSRSNPLIGAVPVDNEFVDDDEYDDEDEFDDDPMSAGDPTGAGALQWSPMASKFWTFSVKYAPTKFVTFRNIN